MKACITNYTNKRYIFYILATIVIFALPFIRVNKNHFFLLSFDHKKLNLFFVAFDTQELYLMPFLLILLFLTIFFITTLAGRIWCAWSCPQTIFRVIYRDIIQTKLLKIRKNIKDKQKEFQGQFVKKFIAGILFYCVSIIAVSNLLWYFIPPEDFFAYIQNPGEHMLLIGIIFFASLFLSFDIMYLQEKFCIYVCPYARIQSVMFDHDTIQVIYDEKRGGVIYDGHTKLHKKPPQGECIGCEACVSVCPTHIDIRKGMQLECINCLECADACSKIQLKFNRPSLINWTSAKSIETRQKVNYFRFRTIAYVVVLSIVFIGLLIASTKKEHMLLNINRATELYHIEKKNDKLEVINAYTFLFQNTDNKDHQYYFEAILEGIEGGIEIVSPSKPFTLKAGANTKKVVTLRATKKLANDDKKDTIIPLHIRAYAVDDENIVVFRESIFSYPKNTEFDKFKDEKK
ncbi:MULTISPECIES: cytochrome c oxidase accessory protein CcoG [unclassified Campylobacter]|uniref:cytochrome c oxidase accessory protein CcoG n=1 Tax=unclassified Campylobacter TaxID=2593542 RepID=UPI0012383213|nr:MULTISPECIES: cytochrome c oxidase accessory protein CcoG [unclassified Campylobacter]KAA6227104.1 cytochrome c oxidase accessory protein CcoG [Campylobacter sp. LR185c]KAA6227499.1 cytochrome c oxidase accessory protein CcoG [Campylobacter sp. LR196d]KAA6228525.1 cytochrome c oxidase accessory protein CcoG [Campylobacter sp. LR286c]KAA6230916.1 cytochrome c oxidase accessory protein CcoG [Campylobacter sp. LR291e]KAA6233550.1 cytochrome c oxidase accessory protein CcoG [Campylobacter sp. L